LAAALAFALAFALEAALDFAAALGRAWSCDGDRFEDASEAEARESHDSDLELSRPIATHAAAHSLRNQRDQHDQRSLHS
jgi:hypothetical protein